METYLDLVEGDIKFSHLAKRLAEMESNVSDRQELVRQVSEFLKALSVTVAQSEPTSFRAAQNSNFDKRI